MLAYFLGTLLLHEEEIGPGRKEVNIVDGQQRMTTSVVFIATALALHKGGEFLFTKERPALLQRNFVEDEVTELQKFHTIEEDEPFFRSGILGVSDAPCALDSPSSRRLKLATIYFAEQVAPDEWEALIYALKTAKVMVYSVDSAEDATQIFELQNDRGKSLTSLEALKSFLMHCVYLHSSVRADDRLAALQTQFSKIFRTVESLAELKRTPDEDQLLADHCTAFLKWSEYEYNNPKHLVKATIKAMKGTGVIDWIEKFVSFLLESYQTVKAILNKRDELQEFSELFVLGRVALYWPLIIKTWHYDKSADKKQFRMTCRLLEVFTFRGYAVGSLRADTGVYSFQTAAKDFTGDFTNLFSYLRQLCQKHNLENRFLAGLDNSYFYSAEGNDALYLLWRYENHLRAQPGQKQPPLSWKDFAEPRSTAEKLSIEHIAARTNPIADSVVAWVKDEPKPFHEVALDRLGNLVIDSISPNSSKGPGDFASKLESLSKDSIYLSQGELINFLKDSKGSKDLVWDVEAIRERHKHLVNFALETWNPNAYHIPPAQL